MDPNSSPAPNRSDPAPDNAMSASAGTPALEAVTPAGPVAPGSPAATTNVPLKTVLETVLANNGDQPNGECTVHHLPDWTVG